MKHACITKHDNIKLTQKLKLGLVAFYDIRPGNGMGLFSKKWIGNKVNNNNNNDRLTAFDPGQPG